MSGVSGGEIERLSLCACYIYISALMGVSKEWMEWNHHGFFGVVIAFCMYTP